MGIFSWRFRVSGKDGLLPNFFYFSTFPEQTRILLLSWEAFVIYHFTIGGGGETRLFLSNSIDENVLFSVGKGILNGSIGSGVLASRRSDDGG